MTQRVAFAFAAAMVAFIIVVMGALGAYVALNRPVQTTAFASAGGNAQDTTSTTQSGGLPSQEAPQTQGSDPAGYTMTPDQAVGIALSSAAGSSLVQEPRLVNFQGTAAYEVQLDRGYVYVDAMNGHVLFNGATVQRRTRRGR